MRQNKKEFITYWTPELVIANVSLLPANRQRFFHMKEGSRFSRDNDHTSLTAMLPDNISYEDLVPFVGKKTKVTIEVIP